MRLGKWTLVLVALILLGGTAMAQQINANRLCLSNGSEYFVGGIAHTQANTGVGKYYPAHAHWAGKGICEAGLCHWPWKIQGWAWGGMQAFLFGPTWYWLSTLSYSVDAPYSSAMTWPYPFLHAIGVSHSGFPNNIFGHTYTAGAPSALLQRSFILPSSAGGLDPTDANLLAYGATTWLIPSTSPFYGWTFGYSSPAASAFTLPSNISIYQYIYEGQGLFGQYITLSGNEMDCTWAAGGIKSRNHVLADDNNYIYTWVNTCTGASTAWDMCLFLTDAVALPVNLPGAANWANPYPYWGYNFDVGDAMSTPNSTSNALLFQMTYEDFENPGTQRFMLMGSPWVGFVPLGTPAPAIPFGPVGYRLPHGLDALTDVAFALLPFTVSLAPSGLYPACLFGTTIGSLGGFPLPLPNNFLGLELKFSGISTVGRAPSASFLVTYF